MNYIDPGEQGSHDPALNRTMTPPAWPQFTAHDILERERLIRSQEHAEQIRRNPQLLEQAQAFVVGVAKNGDCSSGQLLWRDLLLLDLETVLTRMMADNPEGQLLRSDSPFHVIIKNTNDAERRRSWRRAKAQLSNGKT